MPNSRVAAIRIGGVDDVHILTGLSTTMTAHNVGLCRRYAAARGWFRASGGFAALHPRLVTGRRYAAAVNAPICAVAREQTVED